MTKKAFLVIILAIFSFTLSEDLVVKPALAIYQYTATGGQLVTGSEQSGSQTNTGSFKGTFGDDNNAWETARANPGGLNKHLQFDGVELSEANKLILRIRDNNVTTADAYIHQICDWTSSSTVDDVADTQCTGGGWRTLQPRKTSYTNTTEQLRIYDIYDGYFSSRDTSPGTVVSTPLSNFIESTNKRVLVRASSSVDSATVHSLDSAQLEAAIHPVYEPAEFVKDAGSTTTNFISDLVGQADGTNVTASDGNRLQIPMAAVSQAVDVTFKFKNIDTYTGMNTILALPEVCVSNAELTFGVYLRNFNNGSWTQIGSDITGSACNTDTEYALAFNDTTISGFNFGNHISSTNEIWLRFLTNAPATVRSIQFDRIYLMLGSVNSDSAKCEISWGTGTATATDCTNTRDVEEGITAAPTTSTWQATSVLEYPSAFYADDNDDDANDSEAAFASNLSFPITVAGNMSITGIHYAGKYRSNNTAITIKPQIRDYSGQGGTSGWADVNESGKGNSERNNAATYTWSDSWRHGEGMGLRDSPYNGVDTANNLMNLRMRTSASTDTTAGDVNDWDFAMMSVSWVEESKRRTLSHFFPATGSQLVTGSEVSTGQANTGSYKAVLGNDEDEWQTARANPGGLNKHIQFDGVELQGANKITVELRDNNITTGDGYLHQICDWVSAIEVDNTTDSQCTGGGWRTLQPRRDEYTVTSEQARFYSLYNGYFSLRDASPGTILNIPLSNFVRSSDKRVLLRIFSTVDSTTQHTLDTATLEVGIDPVYEPADPIIDTGTASSNFISEVVGYGAGTNDSNRLAIQMPGAGTAADVTFKFRDVRTYTGMNTIFVGPDMCVSDTSLTFTLHLRNFNSNSWTQIGSTNTGTACGTDTVYAFSFNSDTVTGFNFSDHISSANEIWARFLTNAPSSVQSLQFDRLFVMLGSVNSNSAQCEISWGTGTATNCVNTRDVKEGIFNEGTTSSWQVTSALEYPSSFYSKDNDDDANDGETAFASNLSFPITTSADMAITRLHHVVKHRSNNANISQTARYRDYAGVTDPSGWEELPNVGSNNSTSYSGESTGGNVKFQTSVDDFIDTFNNVMKMRFETSASTDTTDGDVNDIDFAIMSVGWLATSTPQISVGTTGKQSSVSLASNRYVGGAFTFIRNSSSANVTQVIITDTGSVNANQYLSNLDLYYETGATCQFDATETLFGTATSFDTAEKATVTGTMSVGTEQTCVYAIVDVAATTPEGRTIELEISSPSSDVTVSAGTVAPGGGSLAIPGSSTIASSIPSGGGGLSSTSSTSTSPTSTSPTSTVPTPTSSTSTSPVKPFLPLNPTLGDIKKAIADLASKLEEALNNITDVSIPALIQEITQKIDQIQKAIDTLNTSLLEKTLYRGMTGNEVRSLQEFLKAQGTEVYPEGLVTGYFGPLTEAAVKRFQLKHQIVTDKKDWGYGYVGPKTRAKINSLLKF